MGMSMNVIALDIGGTKISGAIITSMGDIVSVRQCPTEAVKGAEFILNSAFNIIDELRGNNHNIKGIGIASAGRINFSEGSVTYATSNLPGWTGLNLRNIFQNKYNLPTVIDNDVNAAAIGEGWLGAARELDSYICLTLGTGVGGAFVSNNRLWRGSQWNGAELGHMILKADGRSCNCGLSGCVEQYISGTAIYNRYNELSKGHENSAAEVFRKLAEKDRNAERTIDEFKVDLIDTILSLNNIFDPQGYILGGGILKAKDYWWDDVVRGVNNYRITTILPAQLGNNAGLAGAARLILDELN